MDTVLFKLKEKEKGQCS